jgi:hypothetical protein
VRKLEHGGALRSTVAERGKGDLSSDHRSSIFDVRWVATRNEEIRRNTTYLTRFLGF